MRILIVDDHPMFRKGVKNVILENIGDSQVFEAGSAQEAEIILSKDEIDLVTLDINLGEDNGLKLIDELKSSYSGLKIVMLTMYDIEEFFNEAVESGVDGYLLKDSPEEEIVLALKICCSGKKYFSSSLMEHVIDSKTSGPDLSALTVTESKVLRLVAEFKSSKEIAEQLFVSHRTIENHRTNIKRKLNLTGKNSLTKFAVSNKELI